MFLNRLFPVLTQTAGSTLKEGVISNYPQYDESCSWSTKSAARGYPAGPEPRQLTSVTYRQRRADRFRNTER